MTASKISKNDWEVIVIGGGPAGSTAATMLSKAGRKVLVLEKTQFPRFHIGESLLPYNREIFNDLGVWPKIEAAGFMKKRGAQFLMGNGEQKVRMDFSRGSFTEFPEAIHVERSKFDDILLHHSREAGAEVREESLVLEHRVEKDRAVVRYRTADGREQEISTDFLVDASGLTNFTGNRESVREFYEGHKKVAIFGHFSGVKMPSGDQKGDILIVRRENSWFWLIPLDDDKTSVGLVMDRRDFQELKQEPAEVFNAATKDTITVWEIFSDAVAVSKMQVTADFSYRNGKLVSPRIVRAGDAMGFIDPVFSSGVLLAMGSGRDAAHVVNLALKTGGVLTSDMRKYERKTRRKVAMYWEFIENFYKPHFAQLFFQPVNRWRVVCSVNCVLAGRTNLTFAAWWRLRLFFFLAWLNNHISLLPRIPIR